MLVSHGVPIEPTLIGCSGTVELSSTLLGSGDSVVVLPVPIAAVESLGAPLGVSGRAQALHVHVHHALGDVLDHLPQQIGVRALFHELGECDIGLGGHRDVLRFRLDGVVTPTLNQTHDDRLCSLRGPFGDRVCLTDPELRLGSEEENQKTRTPQDGTSAPYMTPAAKEQEAIRFKRCEGFSTGNAFASLPPRKGGYPKEYWLDRATQSGDGLAEVQALSVDLSQMGAPDDANAKLKASMETHEARALSSGDPAALMMLGTVLGNPSPLQDTDAAFALQVAACETGFDCSFSNPHFGYCLPDQDNCYKTGTYEGMLRQGYGAAGYARLYAKAQDIEDLLQRGEAGIVVGKYLAMK